VYPNPHKKDYRLTKERGREQHAFHASRRAPQERGETEVGPFRLEVLEPMRQVRVTIAPNDTGIEANLTFSARTACIEEGRQTMRRDGRIIMDATRFTQFGRWDGSITYAGRRVAVDPKRVYGTKDRSWGVRPVGEPELGGAPARSLPQIFFLWAPIQWGDFCTHAGIFENADGSAWHAEAVRMPVYPSVAAIPGVEDPALEHLPRVSHKITYEKGTRRARAVELTLAGPSGTYAMQLEPILRFQMKGIGYMHPEWGHGVWKGDLVVAGESWKSDDLDPLAPFNLHIQQVVRARMGDKTGVGVVEQLCLGPHAPSGFTEFLDGAR
jgi:hypothetical protein